MRGRLRSAAELIATRIATVRQVGVTRGTRRARLALLMGAAVACSNGHSATITVTTGEEADAFARQPTPTTLVVERLSLDGKATEIARTSLSSSADVSLGDLSRGDIGTLRVTALDPGGKVLLHGESLPLQFGALENASFEVFVQRTAELARLPRAPGVSLDLVAGVPPTADLVEGRFLIATQGTATVLYDLLQLQAFEHAPALPRAAKSLAITGTSALAIDEGGATALELSSGQSTEVPPPAGGRFSDLAGGAAITTPDGTVYVVGGTRPSGGPTARILRIGTDGTLTFTTGASPREGACAAWVDGRGLVIAGGSATAAGAEVLAPNAPAAAPLPYPPDPTHGCAAAALDGAHVVLAGGTGGAADPPPARVLDLGCGSGCAPLAWPGAVPLTRADALSLAADAALVVGDAADGASHAYRVSAAGTKELTLRVPRRGARLVPMSYVGTRAVAIVGGAPAIEQYLE